MGGKAYLGAMAAALGLVSGAWGQSTPEFEAWFERVARLHETLGDPALYAEYTVAMTHVPPAAELEAMRQRVKDHPQHPDRDRLAMYEERALGRAGEVLRVWYSRRAMRSSGDPLPGVSGEYTDFGVGGEASWVMTPESLIVAGEGSAKAPAGYQYSSMKPQRGRDLLLLLGGGVAYLSGSGDEWGPATIRDGAWTREGVRGGGADLVRAAGTWDAARGVGRVIRVELIRREEGRDRVLAWYEGEAFEALPELGIEYSRRAREVDGEGSRTVEVLALRVIGEAEVESRARVPGMSDRDLVRGMVTYRSVRDHRSGQASVVLEDGTTRSEAVAEVEGRMPAERLRRIGWGIAAGLGAVLVGVGIWRRGSTSRSGVQRGGSS